MTKTSFDYAKELLQALDEGGRNPNYLRSRAVLILTVEPGFNNFSDRQQQEQELAAYKELATLVIDALRGVSFQPQPQR